MKMASLVSPWLDRQVPPRTIWVRGRRVEAAEREAAESGMAVLLRCQPAGNAKNPAATGRGCFAIALDLLAVCFTWPQAGWQRRRTAMPDSAASRSAASTL